ncbi:60S ribosomal protein L24 [Rhizoclosmatium hyalinum]|nr:60S ribosomal protein L24 [Rhizoclosmatium hyalinum]
MKDVSCVESVGWERESTCRYWMRQGHLLVHFKQSDTRIVGENDEIRTIETGSIWISPGVKRESIHNRTHHTFNRTEICNFSGFKIYPGHGKTYIKADSRSYRLINGKCESLFLQRIKPSKLDWTIVFRRLHKKGQAEEASKKRSRRTVKAQRAVVGATLDAIKAKKAQKPELRASLRAAAAAKSKEAKKVAQEKKKAELSQVKAAQKGNISKQQSKGAGKKIQATSR